MELASRSAFFILLTMATTAWAGARFTGDDLIALAKSGEVKSASELLSRLPEDIRKSFTLMHSSQSLHESSPVAPRAILFSEEGELFITFNGNPDQRGFESVEIATFDAQLEKVFYREIMFQSDLKRRTAQKERIPLMPADIELENEVVTISKVNPLKCLGCHSTGGFNRPLANDKRHARYIWRAYPNWKGAYGAQDDFYSFDGENRFDQEPVSDKVEFENLKAFRASAAAHERYKFLIFDDTETAPYCAQFRSDDYRCRRNFHVTAVVAINQGRQLAKYLLQAFGRSEALRYLRQMTGAPGEHPPFQTLSVEVFGRKFSSINAVFEGVEIYNNLIKGFAAEDESSLVDWYAGYEGFLKRTYKGGLEDYFVSALVREIAKSDERWAARLADLRDRIYSEDTPVYGTFSEVFRERATAMFLDLYNPYGITSELPADIQTHLNQLLAESD